MARKRSKADGTGDAAASASKAAVEPMASDSSHSSHSSKKSHSKRQLRSSRRLVFIVGALVGVVIALLMAKRQVDQYGSPDMGQLFSDFFDDMQSNLPTGIMDEARRLKADQAKMARYEAFQVGRELREQGLTANRPVIMIPGVISTGLESWSTQNCSMPYFRKRLWGSWTMIRAMFTDKDCWMQHIMLDKETGLDPEGIKLRAAQGFDAADFFITGYWIWSKIIENLAAMSYDPNTMFTAGYDWRLSYANLEKRDGYFTKLKSFVETANKLTGKKSVLVSHSMGSQVLLYFLKWVEANGDGFGNGGPSWVNDNVESIINVSGCLLGVPKAMTALLSGEMRDTAQLNALSVYGLEKFLAKVERAELLRSMPGIASMLPKGGNRIWGNATFAPEDVALNSSSMSHGAMIHLLRRGSKKYEPLSTEEAIDYLKHEADDWFRRQVENNYSDGIAFTAEQVEENMLRPEKWINPLETRLPLAPNLTIYNFYGVGKQTERAYFYKERDLEDAGTVNKEPGDQTLEDIDKVRHQSFIDNTVTHGSDINMGVVLGEGDGTVNLISSGFMGARGWGIPRYNPANVTIRVHEMLHEPDTFDIRGGPGSAEHVDILGRSELNEMIGLIAAGHGHDIKTKFISNICEISEQVDINGP